MQTLSQGTEYTLCFFPWQSRIYRLGRWLTERPWSARTGAAARIVFCDFATPCRLMSLLCHYIALQLLATFVGGIPESRWNRKSLAPNCSGESAFIVDAKSGGSVTQISETRYISLRAEFKETQRGLTWHKSWFRQEAGHGQKKS